jgi:hypothetical protein
MRTISAPKAAMAVSRSTLTCRCSTITQRTPMLCAAAASARPWLPSVALTTTSDRSPAACAPRSTATGSHAGWARRTSRTSAAGAPSALKLPSVERLDSSFTKMPATPSSSAMSGSCHSGVGSGASNGQRESQARVRRASAMLRMSRSSPG